MRKVNIRRPMWGASGYPYLGMPISRREFTALAGGALASMAFGSACDGAPFLAQTGNARLKARPKHNGSTTARGKSALGLGGTRDAILSMPSVIPAGPMPLAVMLHGAGGSADRFLQRFGTIPDETGVALLSVDSRGQTWDGIRGGFGPDVEFLDRALTNVFDRVAVDPARLALGGFSDGATYGLSLGLINGDLFRTIVAFSPGFIVEDETNGRPRVFISHGTRDEILPIERCSRVIVPELKKRGYEVTFREFDGVHEMPPAIVKEGLSFVAAER
jgi:phospholipase/carboxylesterase